MRRYGLRLLAGWCLILSPARSGDAAIAADPPRDDRMAAIVAAVRAEEAKFRDIEYTAKVVVRDPERKDPAGLGEATTLATRRVVLQGERSYFRHQSFERLPGSKGRREVISACDGERTRTVVAGDCANIHLGRARHPEICPAHTLPLAHDRINFPMSVYLGGTEAIHAHLQYPPGLAGSGRSDLYTKIVAQFEGEEVLDGLRCLRVRVDRWYSPNDASISQHLWLAPERNYHCVRERHRTHEMRVAEMRQVAPGVWFPTRITVIDSAVNARQAGNRVATSRTETMIETIDLAPRHDAAFFRDVSIPPGLPVFTIEGRRLVGSALPEPIGGDRAAAKLAEVAARVAAQERRYDDIEVKARVRFKTANPDLSRWDPERRDTYEARSVLRGDLAYHVTRRQGTDSMGWAPLYQVEASDGRWSRTLWGHDPTDPRGLGVRLREGLVRKDEGYRDGIFVYRPHNLLLRDWWIFSTLADLLASPLHDRIGSTTLRFRHGGTAEIDGHPCLAVRGDFTSERWNQSGGPFVLYLATDRNHIPIRMETYDGDRREHLMPSGVYRCDDFREIAPGLWYPFRVNELALQIETHMGQGWIGLSWRRDYTIDAVTLAPKVDEALFRGVIAPAGAWIQVQDERGQTVGQYQQREAGVPSLTAVEYLKLLAHAPTTPAKQQERRKASEALIGRPAPTFPARAAWLGGRPLDWPALRGRVVVLGFWAEWSDECREDLGRLARLHRDRGRNGLTIVGVHPPGSEPAAIKKAADAQHLEFPTCIDAPAAEGTDAWGEIFGRFAVQGVPHAVAVDAAGTIIASGRLEDVLARAGASIPESR